MLQEKNDILGSIRQCMCKAILTTQFAVQQIGGEQTKGTQRQYYLNAEYVCTTVPLHVPSPHYQLYIVMCSTARARPMKTTQIMHALSPA